jgi:cobalt-zinc-cadmium efflux system membrane fusion protein
MHCSAASATVLVIEPDVVLGQVLSKVLARDGLVVIHAVNAAQALQLAEQHAPQVALVGCCRRWEEGLQLAEVVNTRYSSISLILMSAYSVPPRALAWTTGYVRVLTNLDLRDLRQAVDSALSERTEVGVSSSGETLVAEPSPLMAWTKELRMPVFLTKSLRIASIGLVIVAVAAGLAMATGAVHVPWAEQGEAKAAPPAKPEPLAVRLVEGQAHTLFVPDRVREALGIRKGQRDLIADAKKPTKTRPLVMPGSTALDPTRLHRVRARFAPSPSSAQVVQIAQVPEDPAQSGKLHTVFREIRSGDHIRKGDLLAVFESVDVGNKKNDLIDAIYQLELDEQILKKAESKAEVVPEVFLWTAQRQVQGDINTVNRTVSTLKTWGIADEDIQAVRDEAEEVKKRKGKHDKEKDALWARVEMRAPDDGVIIERNVSLKEIVVDNTTNLFQIAKVDRLLVFAYVPEDDLPALKAIPTADRRWTVRTVGSPPLDGFISDIGLLIDPNQHTAVVKGYIDNPNEVLAGGQFISATAELPPPSDVVEVPIGAVVEDGQQCVVFVETDANKHYYTMRRVQLVHRFDKTVFVRSKPFAKEEERTHEEEEFGLLPKEPLRPGERIIQSGVGELKAALLDKESQPNEEKKQDENK